MAATPAQRILFHGVTGSGKTTAARAYAEAVGLPFHSFDDAVGWLPGWQKRPAEEQRKLAAAIAAGDRWVVDSVYSSAHDLLVERAELVVALDYPRLLSLGRLLRRTLRRCITGQPVCNGNTETWRLALSRESIIVWHFRSFSSKRKSLAAMQADPGMPPVISFRRPRDLAAWIAGAGHAAGTAETSDGRQPAPAPGDFSHRKPPKG